MPPNSQRLPVPPLQRGAPPQVQPDRAATTPAASGAPEGAIDIEEAWRVMVRPGETVSRREKAAVLVVRGHFKPMLRKAQHRYRLSLHDAEDTVQDALLLFLQHASEDWLVPEAYLYTVFRNCCINTYRRRHRERDWVSLDQTLDDEGEGPGLDLPAPLATTDPALLLQWRRTMADVTEVILAQTPARLQVMQAMAKGFTEDAEIAARLGISEAAVGDRKYRVRLILRTIFKDLFQ